MAAFEAQLSSLLEHHQLQVRECNRPISTKHLDDLALSHCREWRKLPSRLEMDDIVVHDVDMEPIKEDRKRRAFFLKWKEIKGSEATYKKLIVALLAIRCRGDADGVCQMLRDSRSSGEFWGRSDSASDLSEQRWRRKWLCLGKE
jgi:hypothetical protein